MVLPQDRLYMHIVTRECVVDTVAPDSVSLLKQKYGEDYSSEYVCLGSIYFTKDSIKCSGNYDIMAEKGVGVRLSGHTIIARMDSRATIWERIKRMFI